MQLNSETLFIFIIIFFCEQTEIGFDWYKKHDL